MFQSIRRLFVNLIIYGMGDVATSIVSFLLLPLFTRYLSPQDYGVIGLLLVFEVVTKILFRWGIDASFMRMYYDCEDEGEQQQLASTIFFFLLAVNGTLLAFGLAAAPALSTHAFGDAEYTTTLRLVLLNTFVVGFYFIPFHTMRIEGRPTRFITLTFIRSSATVLGRLYFVIGAGMGVLGIVLADVLVTAFFTILLARWFARLIRPRFSRTLLAEALGFGLPRIPHGIAHQIIAVADRYILRWFGTVTDVGLYSIGASFGLALKLFLSAFEYAWAPFYFEAMRRPEAKDTFRVVTTYSLAVLIFLTVGVSAVSDDVVRLMTTPAFEKAAVVIPWIALGVLFQGVYLLTSIGLNITKRTKYYPLATGISAAISLTANVVLVPRYGVQGAAWANALSYGVLAGISMWFSQRLYPIAYEYGRIVRLVLAAAIALLAARRLVPVLASPWIGTLVRGGLVTLTYPLVLGITGFLEPREIDRLQRVVRLRSSPGPAHVAASEQAELAGEIVSATMPEQLERLDDQRAPRSRMA